MIFVPCMAGLFVGYLCSDPYCRTRVDTSIPNDPNAHCLYWEDPKITFVQSANGNPPTPDLGFPAVSKAWSSWESVAQSCGSSLSISEGAHSTSRQIGYVEGGPNENLLVFREKYCPSLVSQSDPCWSAGDCMNVHDCWAYPAQTIALTTSTYDTDSGVIYRADIELNGSKFTFTDVDSPPCCYRFDCQGGCCTQLGVPVSENQNCVGTDIQNTVTHETGHAIGLDHNTNPSSTMYNSAPPSELSKRVIDPGSAKFVCDVYPRTGAPRDCIIVATKGSLGPTPGCASALGPLLGLLGALSLLAAARRARR